MIFVAYQHLIMKVGISVKNDPLTTINLSCRLGLGFLYVYHGLVPKIIWLSSTEVRLVQLSGSGIPAEISSPIAGVIEIALGLCIIFLRNTIYPIYIAAASLVLLLLYTAFLMPSLLIEAFNPVSTNVLGLVLCYITINSQTYNKVINRT
jgi:hypothetical protein